MPASTTKVISIANAAGTSKQFAPEVLNSDVATDAIYRSLINVDWGQAPHNKFLLARTLRDGEIYRGGVWGPRSVNWQTLSRVNTSSTAFGTYGAEPIRDDEESVLNGFLLDPAGAPFWLQQTRTNATGGTVKRRIRARLDDFKAWKWTPDSIDDGMVGTHAGPVLVKSLAWRCLFPWLVSYDTDASIVTSAGNTLDATNRTVTLANNGDVPCGLKITINGATGTTGVLVCNGYNTGSYSTPNNSIVISSLSGAGAAFVVDWYGSDPESATATRSGTDCTTSVAAGSLIQLAKGNNTINFATSSVVTGWTIDFAVYPLWGSP